MTTGALPLHAVPVRSAPPVLEVLDGQHGVTPLGVATALAPLAPAPVLHDVGPRALRGSVTATTTVCGVRV